MPTTTLLPTDELLKTLEQSALSAEEKTELAELLTDMTDDERIELQALIEEANQEKAAVEKENQAKMAQLNEETNQKLERAEQEESKYARDEIEKIDEQETAKELTEVENSMEQGQENQMTSQANDPKVNPNDEKNHKKSRHLVQNFILIILGLALLAIALIFGLSHL